MKIPKELDDQPVGILVPGPNGYIRVVRRCKREPMNGKLKRSTILSLIYRAADSDRFRHRRIRWQNP